MNKIQRTLALLTTLVMLISCCAAYAAGEWHCPYCGQMNDRNFCISCGAPRPEEPVWAEDDIADPALAASFLGIGGDLLLEVTVEFEENFFFSTYDVDMYLDSAYLATLPHGVDFHAYFSVPQGDHILTFCENGNHQVYGETGLAIYGSTSYSCRIQAKSSQVKISNEKVYDPFSLAPSMSIDRYMASCRVADYGDIAENPQKNRGKKIAVTGRVLQSVEGALEVSLMRIEDENGFLWFASRLMTGGSSGLNAYDTVTLYGECTGLTTYLTVAGDSITVPSIDVKYIALH